MINASRARTLNHTFSFKVSEEYPAYLRSVELERLAPATEYSLRVAAVYLNGGELARSQRVTFVSPTDNESRRFKENTYRPIHKYPDEPRELHYGLAHVRCEELTIVAIALVFWIGTIWVFFNNWGKIRMLEPYQPAYRDVAAAQQVSAFTQAAAQAATHHTATHASLHNLSAIGVAPAANSGANLLAATNIQPQQQHIATTNLHGGGGKMSMPLDQMSLAGGGSQGTGSGLAPAAASMDSSDASPAAMNGAVDEQLQTCLVAKTQRLPQRGAAAALAGPELNYLFQAKAHALAKATLVWSKQKAALRSPQERARAFVAAAAAAAAADQQQQAARRAAYSRQMSQCSGGGGTAAPPPPAPLLGRPSNTSTDALRELRRATMRHDARPSQANLALACHNETLADQHKQQYVYGSQVTQSEDAAPKSACDQPASNKLRRMLFSSRSHQHHHMATSLSASSQLVAGWPPQPPSLSPTPFGQQQQQRVVVSGSPSPTAHTKYSSSRNKPVSMSLDCTARWPKQGSRPRAQHKLGSVQLDRPQTLLLHTASSSQASSLESGGAAPPAPTPPPPPPPLPLPVVRRDDSKELPAIEPTHILVEPPSPPSWGGNLQSVRPSGSAANAATAAAAAAARKPSNDAFSQLAELTQRSRAESCGYCSTLEHVARPQSQNGTEVCVACEQQQQQQQQAADEDYYAASNADSDEAHYGECSGAVSCSRPRISSMFVASPYTRTHRNSFAMLRALSQKKSKSAEDVAHLSSLVLQIWSREHINPLLLSASQQQLANERRHRSASNNNNNHNQHRMHRYNSLSRHRGSYQHQLHAQHRASSGLRDMHLPQYQQHRRPSRPKSSLTVLRL